MCFPLEVRLMFTCFVIIEKNRNSHTGSNLPALEMFPYSQVSELDTGVYSVMKRWQHIIVLPKASDILRTTFIWNTNEVHISKGPP